MTKNQKAFLKKSCTDIDPEDIPPSILKEWWKELEAEAKENGGNVSTHSAHLKLKHRLYEKGQEFKSLWDDRL